MGTEKTLTYTLSNGLTVILHQDSNASIVTAKTVVGVGSVHEKDFPGSGISHYLEHLVAGGTTTFKDENSYKEIISTLGGVSNAYTTTDHTSYFINTSPKHLKTAITTLYEWMFHCALKPSEVSRERDVITREIEKNNVNIHRKFYYTSQKNTYHFHTARYPVIGYLEQFLELDKKDLEQFYRAYYTPSNMTLIIGGPLNIDSIKTHIKKTFGQEKEKAKPIHPIYEEPEIFTSRLKETELKMNASLVSLRFQTANLYDPDLYPLDLLDYILGNGNQSILHQALVEKKKLAYSVSTTSYTPAYAKGYFEVLIETNKDQIEDAIKETLKHIESAKHIPFKKQLIEKSKKQKLAEQALSITSLEDKTSQLAMSYLYSQTTNFFEVYSTKFKKITAKTIQKTAKKYFDTEKLITTLGYPIESKKEHPTQANFTQENNHTKLELKNGTRVIFYPRKKSQMTKIQIMVEGGILKETPKNNGIGALTASLLGKATSKKTTTEIENLFESNGAVINASLGNHTLTYTLDCLEEDSQELIPLFFETFFDAKFNQTTIDEEKRKLSNIIKQRDDSWFSSNSAIFKKSYWGKVPYSLPLNGELQSLKLINKKSIEDYFASLQNPQKTIISVYGNINKTQITDLLNSYSKLQTASSKASKRQAQTTKTKSITKTHNHKFETSSLFMGFNAPATTQTSEKIKMDLIDAILSGMSYPGGRLHNKLRDKGYVYLVHGINFNGLYTGSFYIYALSNTESIQDVKKIILEEIDDIKNNLVSTKEFKEAIERISFYYKERSSSIENKLLIDAVNELIHNTTNYEKNIEKEIQKLTREDIKTTAKKYLNNPETHLFIPKKKT